MYSPELYRKLKDFLIKQWHKFCNDINYIDIFDNIKITCYNFEEVGGAYIDFDFQVDNVKIDF